MMGCGLGGHVGIEILPQLKGTSVKVKGLMLVGTPPALGAEQIASAFKCGLGLAGTMNWTDQDSESFARNNIAGGKEERFESWMLEDARRADGRTRMLMAEKFLAGEGVDQVKVVEEEDVLVAVVNGSEEKVVNLDYLDSVRWKRLWRGQCVRIEGCGCVPFWEDWGKFEGLLAEFLEDCGKEEIEQSKDV